MALFLVFSIACLAVVASATSYANVGNETDKLALLKLKAKITDDPSGMLASWNDSTHFCNWFGVTCGKRHRRVTQLSLGSLQLRGSISPHIGNLSFLRIVDLGNNRLMNQIPHEMGYLRRLQILHLYNNSLSGEIPSNISRCANLVSLRLGQNSLVGGIPLELGLLSRIQYLSISNNNLTGEIPSSLGNLSSLAVLSLGMNNLVGSIPNNIGELSQLVILSLDGNKFSGVVPSLHKLKLLDSLLIYGNSLGTRGVHDGDLNFLCSLSNATALQVLYIYDNELGGILPDCIGNLSSQLFDFQLNDNYISGGISARIANLISLQLFVASNNQLSGKVPSLQNLHALTGLGIDGNSFGTRRSDDLNFLCSLTNATDLQILKMDNNDLGGSIPECIGNSANLNYFSLGGNYISGVIPESLGNLTNLNVLSAGENNLQGSIPPRLGKCKNLQFLDLSRNRLSGVLPPEAIAHSVVTFFLEKNNIHGRIPLSLCNATKLEILDLGANQFSGTIPDCIIRMSSTTLGVLDLSGNNIVGAIPDEFGKGCKLEFLDLCWNFLVEQIPRTLANCKGMKLIDLENNQLNDTFPCHLNSLSQLQVLILKTNKLSGPVFCPGKNALWPLLQIFVLASNHFSGELITAQFIPKWTSMITGTNQLQSASGLLQYNDSVGGAYQDTIMLTLKENNLELHKIHRIFTSIDLSHNDFQGELPRWLGNLNALVFLNLSHNSLSGEIPSSFGNLSQLESLDLSCNALSGNIPQQLANLNFLEYLNVSFNMLVGQIPTSTQLQSFNASSYEGNPGLYGPPLTPISIPKLAPPAPVDVEMQGRSKSQMELILNGAEVGLPIGLALFVGPLLYIKRWRRWYCEHLGRILMKLMGREDQPRRRRRRRNGTPRPQRRHH